MLTLSKAAVVAGVIFGGVALHGASASAMPIDASPALTLQDGAVSGVQEAYWRGGWPHYGWHRHFGWHRFYGWHRPHWGWHRHWHRWHHWR
jgi:hypothetical protein